MKLVIAEKPSLARAICDALKTQGETFTTCEGNEYYKSQNYYVVAQFGHLLELIMPEEYPENKGKRAPLPYFPDVYKFKVKGSCEKRYETIEKLVKQNDVTEIIHCGDADREGQLLVDLVLERIGNTKPVTRPQFKALTSAAIIAAFKKRANNNAFSSVRDEGMARMLFDFDYGINLSNYATKKSYAKPALNVGRVKGAIMSEIYDREMTIRNFKPEKYYKAASDNEGIKLISKKKFSICDEAEQYAKKLQVGPSIIKDIETTPITKRRPKLLSQTKLQSIMNKKFGYSPDKTLQLAQSLYEKKLTTYPRTNTEYMTEDEKAMVEAILKRVNPDGRLEFRDDKTIFDTSKVDGHSAIIITANRPQNLNEEEMNCYMVIFNRFRAAFCKEPCVYNKTTVIIDNPTEQFKINGETMVTPGWQTFEPPASLNKNKGKDDAEEKEDSEEDANQTLPPLEIGQKLNTDFKSIEKTTTPPPRYTVSTFGAWMENPFRKDSQKDNNALDGEEENLNDEDDYKMILAGLEIGTEATRAGILKTLQDKQYLSLKKSSYKIEPKGEFLVETCRALGIDMSKETTAAMGKTIKDVGKGHISLAKALDKEHKDIAEVIAADKECKAMESVDGIGIGKCPLCGKPIRENPKSYGCTGWKEGCKFNLWKTVAGKTLTQKQIQKLLNDGITNEIKGFKSKAGKSFDAKLKLSADCKSVEFEFVAHRKKTN